MEFSNKDIFTGLGSAILTFVSTVLLLSLLIQFISLFDEVRTAPSVKLWLTGTSEEIIRCYLGTKLLIFFSRRSALTFVAIIPFTFALAFLYAFAEQFGSASLLLSELNKGEFNRDYLAPIISILLHFGIHFCLILAGVVCLLNRSIIKTWVVFLLHGALNFSVGFFPISVGDWDSYNGVIAVKVICITILIFLIWVEKVKFKHSHNL